MFGHEAHPVVGEGLPLRGTGTVVRGRTCECRRACCRPGRRQGRAVLVQPVQVAVGAVRSTGVGPQPLQEMPARNATVTTALNTQSRPLPVCWSTSNVGPPARPLEEVVLDEDLVPHHHRDAEQHRYNRAASSSPLTPFGCSVQLVTSRSPVSAGRRVPVRQQGLDRLHAGDGRGPTPPRPAGRARCRPRCGR